MLELLLLAQDGTSAGGGGSAGSFTDRVFNSLVILFRPDELLDLLGQVPFLLAAIAVTLGILCVFNGYQWHKWVIAILAFMCGLGIGYRLSQEMGRSTVVAASFGGLCAIIATPLLRITVAVFGGITGAFIGANAWNAFQNGPQTNHWAGAVIGFIVIAMLSVVLFKFVIVLFTSVGGAILAICGGIALLMEVPGWETAVRDGLSNNQLLMPLLLAIGTVSGFVLQEARLRANGVKVMAPEGKKE
jgi:hypothetical protein